MWMLRLMRDWSIFRRGLDQPWNPPMLRPGAALNGRGLRQRAAGLMWLIVDLGAYDDEGLGHLRDQVGTAMATAKPNTTLATACW